MEVLHLLLPLLLQQCFTAYALEKRTFPHNEYIYSLERDALQEAEDCIQGRANDLKPVSMSLVLKVGDMSLYN